MADIGTYLHMIKEAEPRFTGRAIKNVTDAIKMRAMDIELARRLVREAGSLHAQGLRREEGDDRGAARAVLDGHGHAGDQPLRRIREFRYSDKSDDAAVDKMLRDARLRERAAREMEEMKREGQMECVSASGPFARWRTQRGIRPGHLSPNGERDP